MRLFAKLNFKRLGFYLGLIAGPLLIYILFRNTDFSLLADKLSGLRLTFVLIIAITTVSQLCAVIAWYLAFPEKMKVKSLYSLFKIRLIGESFAQINPLNLIGGETFKALLLKRWLKVGLAKGAMSILTSRILLVLSMFLLAVIGGTMLFMRFDLAGIRVYAYVFLGMVIILYSYSFYTLGKGHGLFFFAAGLLAPLASKTAIAAKAVSLFKEIDRDMVILYKKRKSAFFSAFFLSIMHMVIGATEYYVIFKALDVDVGFFTCIVFDLSSTAVRSMGFLVPGQLGFEELTNRIMFSLVNLNDDYLWQTVSIIRRGRQFFWIITGFIFYAVASRSGMVPASDKANYENKQ
ncbi:MAG: flippase-like domain-containing protein [Spirochaetes bacterium]|nr:flippase-like domain-containing protein [Spirochaetota bacterium]MBN2771493.1 flippase-like domain-containing protein [Spirochaetota bacterium]